MQLDVTVGHLNVKIPGCILALFQRFFFPHYFQCSDFHPSTRGDEDVNGQQEQIRAFPGLRLGGHRQVKLLTLCADSSYYLLPENTTTK